MDKQLYTKCMTEYEILKKMQNQIFTNSEFPDQVFCQNYGRFRFAEYNWGDHDVYWDVIQSLAKQSGDEYIVFSITKPDPIEYYYKGFGVYPYCTLKRNSTWDDFIIFFEYTFSKEYCDSFQFGPLSVCCYGSSLKWGIYGHCPLETSILAAREDVDIDLSIVANKWRSLEDALDIWIPLVFTHSGMIVPKIVEEPLRKNYSKKSTKGY